MARAQAATPDVATMTRSTTMAFRRVFVVAALAWPHLVAAQQLRFSDDAFLCYTAATVRGDLVLPSSLRVTLTDQFEDGVEYDVRRPHGLCNPAETNGEGIVDGVTHLTQYRIRAVKGVPRHVHQPVRDLRIFNRFGTIVVDTLAEERLLLPAATDPAGGPVVELDAQAHDVDSFKCYRVRASSFPKGLEVSVEDQFESQAKRYVVGRPRLLCAPVDKDGEGIKNPDGHLLCYRVTPATGEPRHASRTGVSTADQFVIHKIDTRREELLCVPSLKNPPAEFCGNGTIDPGEACEQDGDCAVTDFCDSSCLCVRKPPLGRRTFSLGGASAFFTSFLPGVSVATPRGTLVLDGGDRDETDTAPVTVSGPVYITIDVSLGTPQTVCNEILSCTGRIHCSGGFNVDAFDSVSSLGAASCRRDGANSCPEDPSSVCCSNSCEGVGVGSGNTNTVTIGVTATDSGPGALALTCSMRALVGLPFGVDCSKQNYSGIPVATRVLTTGTTTAEVTLHCAGNAAPPDVVPTLTLAGENFVCSTWVGEDGAGTIALTPPAEEPTPLVGGDGANGFLFAD
jgi:hypothetical protein